MAGTMLVRDYMTTNVTALQESDTLLDATMVFVRSTVRHLPVLRGKVLVGVITERDAKRFAPSILSGMSQEGYNQVMETTPLSRVMTRDPLTVGPDQTMHEAALTVAKRRIGCLPVVEGGELKGIITTTDFIRMLISVLEAQQAAPAGSASTH